MKRIINGIFLIIRFLALLAAFALSLFIILKMYQRLNKNIVDSWQVFLPYFLLLICYALNLILHQKSVNSDIFYNLVSCVVMGAIIFIGYRAIMDKNMIASIKLASGINFNYYADHINSIKTMLYGLVASNVLLMFYRPDKAKKKEATINTTDNVMNNKDTNTQEPVAQPIINSIQNDFSIPNKEEIIPQSNEINSENLRNINESTQHPTETNSELSREEIERMINELKL